MSKANKPTMLEPLLRFPQFRNAAGWDVERLGSRGDFLSSLTGKSAGDFDTGDARFIPYMNVFSNTFTDLHDLRAVNVGKGETQNTVARGDVLFTVSSETPEDAGMSSVLLADIENCYLNSFCALFRFHEGRSPDSVFLGYSLRSGVARKHLASGAQGATRYNISKGVFRDVPLLLPDPAEQRKIAECLGSLDDWIAAETDALAALRRHKTGLMQQLFPRPGETRPRLRFPEFQSTGSWNDGSIQSACDLKAGDFVRAEAIADKPAGGLHPCYGGNGLRGYVKTYTHDGEYVLVGRQGALCGNVNLFSGRFHATEHALVANPKGNVVTRWLYYALTVLQLNQYATGQAQPGLSVSVLNPVGLAIPNKQAEQQRIADCLSSLDARISVQADKLATLRDHKRGLMQQLFPMPGAADGGD